MGNIECMGLTIKIVEKDHFNSKKDGFIDLITPDGLIKLYFEVVNNDGSEFKYVRSAIEIENYELFEKSYIGLLNAFVEAGIGKETEIVGFRFFDRRNRNLSPIHVTRYITQRKSIDIRFDFVRPIINPEVKSKIADMNLARKKKRIEDQEKIREAGNKPTEPKKPVHKKPYHKKEQYKKPVQPTIQPTPEPEEDLSEAKPANGTQLLELAERFKRV